MQSHYSCGLFNLVKARTFDGLASKFKTIALTAVS